MLKRIYNLNNLLFPGKVLIIYGPRQVGKTTLLNDFLSKTQLRYKKGSGDAITMRDIFSSEDPKKILEYVSGYDLIVIDEAQKIPNIGVGLKILVDALPEMRVVVTGSSSFELSQEIGEPLTGRKRTHILYPLSHGELLDVYNDFELKEKLEEFLVFGAYPEVITAKDQASKKRVLEELSDSYLLKDVLALDRVRKPNMLIRLVKLLAFQVGNEVSLHELAVKTMMDVKTVENYIDILQKSFVIKYIGAYSGNLRNEITTKGKIYFYDTGMRNAVINNYNNLEDRNDIGALWENFLVMERIKKQEYSEIYSNNYFWRTYAGEEIDWVEERDGKLFAYEFKWNTKKKVGAPKNWTRQYPESEFSLVTPENYLSFIGEEK